MTTVVGKALQAELEREERVRDKPEGLIRMGVSASIPADPDRTWLIEP